MRIKNFKYTLRYVVYVPLVSLLFFTNIVSPVFSQSQEDVNPLYDASKEDQVFANYNYDCSNLAWPSNVKGVYRKFLDGPLDRKWAYTFYIFKSDENILDLEKQHIDHKGTANDPFRTEDNDRLLLGPMYVSDEDAETYGILEEYEGKIICWAGYSGVKCSSPNAWYKVCAGEGVVDAYLCDPNDNTLDRITIETDDSGQCGPSDIGKVIENTAGVSDLAVTNPNIAMANFIPPALQQLENYFLDFVYLIWAFVGTFAAFQLLYIGFQIMVSGFSPERLGKEYSKLAYWVVGLIGFFLAIPALHFVYNSLDIRHTKCFYYSDEEKGYDLTLPGFTFFFKDVCTGEYSIEE
ncbi:hypothetical protein GF362_04445 [Candidatus Dojkabacteria bacterium]|nr:hypothetical protein [Candidatus Dojkabacteria bacterium]